ncbi:MAG: preprotein translocase subunit YajC [Caulobacteraceae bacterium]|nr:preprotein translocase subunit YajC [Caulobacteraceae bacterium]
MTTPADGGIVALIVQFLPFIAIFVLFYFLLIRPQQKRAKEHQAMIAAVKRGDTIVMSSGMIGKVTRVEDAEVNVEIAPSVNVRVVKSMIAEVRNRTAVAANDSKPDKA